MQSPPYMLGKVGVHTHRTATVPRCVQNWLVCPDWTVTPGACVTHLVSVCQCVIQLMHNTVWHTGGWCPTVLSSLPAAHCNLTSLWLTRCWVMWRPWPVTPALVTPPEICDQTLIECYMWPDRLLSLSMSKLNSTLRSDPDLYQEDMFGRTIKYHCRPVCLKNDLSSIK